MPNLAQIGYGVGTGDPKFQIYCFSPVRYDMMNWSTWNLVRKRKPSIHS